MRRAVLILGAIVVLAGSLALRNGFAASLSLSSKSLTGPRTCALVTNAAGGGIDSDVHNGAGGSNFGTATSGNVAGSTILLGDDRRMYLRFDLSACHPAIPSTATVTNALLRIFASSVPGLACRTHDIYRVTSSWTETGITWNNQPFGATINNPPTANRTTSLQIGSSCGSNSSTGYVTGWTVTPDVSAWVAGSATNQGWMIRDDAEGGLVGASATYRTRELNNLVQDPWLVISYVP